MKPGFGPSVPTFKSAASCSSYRELLLLSLPFHTPLHPHPQPQPHLISSHPPPPPPSLLATQISPQRPDPSTPARPPAAPPPPRGHVPRRIVGVCSRAEAFPELSDRLRAPLGCDPFISCRSAKGSFDPPLGENVWPWRLWSSRSSSSSAATTTTQAAGGGHRRTSHRPTPCAPTRPSTAAPSTPASASASCRPRPRHHPHAQHGTTPRSPRPRSCTTGRSAAELSPSVHQQGLLLPVPSSGPARPTPTRRRPAHCPYPSSPPSTRSAVSRSSCHPLTGPTMSSCLCMPSQHLPHPLPAQLWASLVATTLPLRRRISGGSSISISPSTQSWASPCT